MVFEEGSMKLINLLEIILSYSLVGKYQDPQNDGTIGFEKPPLLFKRITMRILENDVQCPPERSVLSVISLLSFICDS